MEGQTATDRQGEEQHEGKTCMGVGTNALASSLSGPYDDDRRGQQQTLPQAHGTEGVNLDGSAVEDKMDGRKAVVEKELLDVRDFLPAPTAGANDKGPDAEALFAWEAGMIGPGKADGKNSDVEILYVRKAGDTDEGFFDVEAAGTRKATEVPNNTLYAFDCGKIEELGPNAGNVRVNGCAVLQRQDV
jgi:hypothetical protein